MLDSTDIKREEVRAKLLQSLSQRYRELDNAPYTARRLAMELTAAEPQTAFNAELIGKTVNAVILNIDRSVSLILTNNQIIGKESDDGANYPSTESGQSDTADGQYNENVFADGNIVNLTFELFTTSWTFQPAHSLRISIACANSPTFEQNEQVDENTVVTIYRDAEHPSKITLPIIPN